MPGISKISAFARLIEMPELGTLDAKQSASLAGPALVAARFNPDLKAKYDQLIAAGKPAKVALTVLMRKLIILANALLRDARDWKQNLA